MMRFIAAIILIALSANPASAEEKSAVLMGVGATPCSDFAESYRRDPQGTDAVFFSWAQGFMSGLNMMQMALKQPLHDLSALPMWDQMARLRVLCEKNPLVPYAYAVGDLVKAFPEIAAEPK